MSAVLFHVQHLLGAGHLYRIAAIAHRLAALDVDTHVISGGRPVPGIDWGAAHLHQLPPAHCAPGDFTTLLDEHDRPVTPEWCAARTELVLDTAARIDPGVAVVESFPFARRRLRFEILPLLEQLRASRCRLVCSVRDILQPKSKPERTEETLQVLRDYFHTVLVHADPSVVRLEDSFAAASAIEADLRYTGFVATDRGAPESGDGEDEIVVSAGGGAVGARLLETALQARRQGCQADRVWRVLVGAASPAEQQSAVPGEGAAVIVEPAREDFPGLLRRCALSVSQAGYNTMTDVMAAACRALVVPFAGDGEVEQTQRANRLQALGVVDVVEEQQLDAARLAAAINRSLARPAPLASRFDLDGARASAAYLAGLV